MSDPLERVSRFIVAHGQCGEVVVSDPTAADLLDSGAGAWLTARCSGCGSTIRELVPTEPMFADFFKLVQEAGIDLKELAAAMGDEEKLGRISARLGQSPAVLREALRRIRKAQEGEAHN